MSVGKGAGEALGRLIGEAGEKAARVAGDIGEGAMRVARDKMAKAADVVDDWGWKGGKEGEITGNEYNKLWYSAFLRTKENTDNLDRLMRPTMSRISKQFRKSKNTFFRNLGEAGDDSDLYNVMANFKYLEDADVPREWTGKIVEVSRGNLKNLGEKLGFGRYADPYLIAKSLSNNMRGMYIPDDPATTKRARETFLSLLPEWNGTLDELVQAAKRLA